MGHSMGGLLAQMLSSRGLASALVLLTPAPPRGIIALNLSSIRSMWSVLTTWGFWRKPHRQTYNEAVYSTMHLLSAKEKKEIYDKQVFESGRAVFEIGLWFLDRNRATEVDAAKINCPVLVIGGTQDRIVPVSVVRKTARKYRDVATCREYADHAHRVIMEPGWEKIAADIADWLKQVSG
jgi:pimeloyl-ACP methyl ester carboxylesterase